MSPPWYATTDGPPDAAWELYHENSKRGPHDGIPAPRAVTSTPDYAAFPALPLTPRSPSQPPAAPSPSRIDGSPVSLQAFSDLLAAVGTLAENDPIAVFVTIEAIESLPRGLARYDPAGHGLRIVDPGSIWRRLEPALVSLDVLRRSAALVFLAADFGAATTVSGERGYRSVLVETGRRLAALEAAAAAAPLRLAPVEFYDREIDALLHLDGLTRSVVAVVAVSG